MSAEEFQDQFHDFRTPDKEQALRQLRGIQCEETVVAARIGGEYCLMLKSAAQTVAAMGIVAEVWEF